MFSDDLFRAVAHQTRGSRVPADHVPRRVELKNAVFLHALDKQAKPFFALAQCALGPPLLSDVLKNNAEKIARKRKNLHRIDSFADALVPVSELSQMPRLLCAEGFQARNGQLGLQEPGKISECLAAEVLECCTREN